MRTLVAGILIVLVLAALASQVALPSYLEGRVEDRLEEDGGTAEVKLEAVPAVTLLARRGRLFEARGSGLKFALGEGGGGDGGDPLGRLDGFGRVDVRFQDAAAGALRMERFELVRDERDAPYELTVRATTTPRELARELRAVAPRSLAGVLGALASEMFPGAGRKGVSVKLDAQVESNGGKPRVTRARGSVGGVPAGPLAEVVLVAVLDQL